MADHQDHKEENPWKKFETYKGEPPKQWPDWLDRSIKFFLAGVCLAGSFFISGVVSVLILHERIMSGDGMMRTFIISGVIGMLGVIKWYWEISHRHDR